MTFCCLLIKSKFTTCYVWTVSSVSSFLRSLHGCCLMIIQIPTWYSSLSMDLNVLCYSLPSSIITLHLITPFYFSIEFVSYLFFKFLQYKYLEQCLSHICTQYMLIYLKYIFMCLLSFPSPLKYIFHEGRDPFFFHVHSGFPNAWTVLGRKWHLHNFFLKEWILFVVGSLWWAEELKVTLGW